MAVIIEENQLNSQNFNTVKYPAISNLLSRVGINSTYRAIQSDNFVSGSAGWQLTAEGNLEATSGTFRGALAATSGTIGGFTIAATTLASGSSIILNSSTSGITCGVLTVGNNIDVTNVTGTTMLLNIANTNSSYTGTVAQFRNTVINKTILVLNNAASSGGGANTGFLEVDASGSNSILGIYIKTADNRPAMRINAVTGPAVPVEGDFWYDGTNLKFRDSTTVRTVTWT